MKQEEKHKGIIYLSLVIIALGVTFSTTLADRAGLLGIVFIALGSLFLIIGMSIKSD